MEALTTLYRPDHFQMEDLADARALVDAHPFGMLVTTTPDGPAISHIPMMFDGQDPTCGLLIGHFARANVHWRAVGRNTRSVAVFRGADAYISPGWYAIKQDTGKVVPTWNYSVVHITGEIETVDAAEAKRIIVEQLTDRFERAFEPAWKVSDAPERFTDTMLRGIVGFRLHVALIEGKSKLSQNRTPSDFEGVQRGLQAQPDISSRAVAADMARLRQGVLSSRS